MNMLRTEVYETKDYDLFISEKTNRSISREHVIKLSNSIKQKNLLKDQPILVSKKINGKYFVIDGQHRLKSCVDLNIPVWYKIAEEATTEDVKILNITAKNWKSADFLNYYINKNNINYIKFQKFFNWSGLRSVDACIKLFHGNYSAFKYVHVFSLENTNGTKLKTSGSSKSSDFKNGKFIYPDDDTIQKNHIITIKELASKCNLEKWDNVSLWCVYFNVILNTPEYNHERMLKQLEKYPIIEFKKGFPNADICINCLQEIYNKGFKHENQLLFNRNKLN